MKDRKTIERVVITQRNYNVYDDTCNQSVNLNLENLMVNMSIAIEVLLDIREILHSKELVSEVKEGIKCV